MKTKHFQYIAIAIFTCILTQGCKANLNLDDIDPTVGLDIGYVVPMGKITLHDSDFVGKKPAISAAEILVIDNTHLDSILRAHPNLNLDSQTVTFVLSGKNRYHSPMRCTFQLMDSTGKTIMDPENITQPLRIFGLDTLIFTAEGGDTIRTPMSRFVGGLTVYSKELGKDAIKMAHIVHSVKMHAEIDLNTEDSTEQIFNTPTFIMAFGLMIDIEADVHIKELF